MSRYLVLSKVDRAQASADRTWVELGSYDAPSQEAAVRAAAADHRDARVLGAVPERSWHPATVEREQVERVRVKQFNDNAKPKMVTKEEA